MTVVTARFDARPGQEATLEAALRALVSQVAQEPGVVEYTLHGCPARPGRFYFYERYTGPDAINAHMATPYLQQLLARVPELCAAPPEVEFYTPLASARPLAG